MKSKIQSLLLAGIFIFFAASPILAVTSPVVSSTSAATTSCDASFLGMPPWYRGLTNADCSIKGPDAGSDGLSSFIWKIVLNAIQMGLVASVYVSVFFVLYGGFQLLVGGYNPSMVEKGRKTILNAVIGLIIGLGSVAILNLLFTGIFGSSTTSSSSGINGLVNLSGDALLSNALNLAYFIAGIVAVIVIIISGIMYTISSGNTARTTKARNILTYAIVGLAIVLLAFVITGYVIGRFGS